MKLMIDLDRVVFDCPSLTFSIGNAFCIKKYKDKKLSYAKINKQSALKAANNLFFLKMSHPENFTPIKGAVESLKRLKQAGHEIHFVSSRPNFKAFQKATVEWFDMHGIDYNSLIFACSNKAKYGELHGLEIAIDDTFAHCYGSMQKGMNAIWLINAYNYKNYYNMPPKMHLACDWFDIEQSVKTIQKSLEKEQHKIQEAFVNASK